MTFSYKYIGKGDGVGEGGGGGEMKWNRRCPPRAWFKLVRMSTYA